LVDAQNVEVSRDSADQPTSARCPSNHSFDVARSGYLNLSRGASPANADTAEMVAARKRFLESRLYDLTINRVAAQVEGDVVLEAGAGPGFYVSTCVDIEDQRVGLAIDISIPAARVAAKAHPRVASIVADVWQPLPVADGCITTVLSVFAPRNLPEFSRLLAPGGLLIVMVPNPGHLASLRHRFDLLRIHPEKVAQLIETMPAELVLEETSQYGSAFEGPAELVRDAIAMGPNAFHGQPDEPIGPGTIDIDVSLLIWRKRA